MLPVRLGTSTLALIGQGTNDVSKSKGGLTQWFQEKWVDLSRPKKGGGFEPCGREDARGGKYPKCVPAARAARMTPEQIESAIRRKRMAESRETREGKKPIMVPTIKKESKNIPADPELYARVKAEAKKKFDVYPSAYANGWLVAEYKRRGGKYKVAKHLKHNQQSHAGRGRSSTPKDKNVSGGGSGKTATDKKAAQHAKEVDLKLRQVAGDKVADTWKPLVTEAMKTWHGQGDMQAPIKVKGKKILVGGREINSQNVLDTMADALGDEIITMGSTFGEGSVAKDSPTPTDVHVPTIMNNRKRQRDLKKKRMKMDMALSKKEQLKDPKGGLTAAGRKHFNRQTGGNLKPGVRGKADTPEKMRRKGSFLTRFFTNPSGPMVKPNGEPTRLALSAAAWGEPVPKNRSDAAKLAQKGRNLLERYENTKK